MVDRSRNIVGAAADPADEIERIPAASRRGNAAADLTGALLHIDRCFARALEGPKVAVLRTFERIQHDPRHTDVIVLQAGIVGCRLFGAWSMAHAADRQRTRASAALHGALVRQEGASGDEILALPDDLIQRQTAWLVDPPGRYHAG